MLRDWPDVVQVFFTIGIVVATCTTQCLLFIPKVSKLVFKFISKIAYLKS